MLTIELLSRYDNNANFRIVIKESPALAIVPNTLPVTMFVARKLHDNAWCIYGLTMEYLIIVCGPNYISMVNTVIDIGTKLSIEQYIFDVIPHDAQTFKLYYF